MTFSEGKKRKCFTFIWELENADSWWKTEDIESPEFTVEEIGETKWKLLLYFYVSERYSGSEFTLRRQADEKGAEAVEIDFELAFMSPDGTVLHSFEMKDAVIGKDGNIQLYDFPSRYEVFHARRSVFLSRDTLTVRCRMWKSVGEISKNVQCIARTRILVEKRSFLWNIKNFSSLAPNNKQPYEIKSLINDEQLLLLELFVTDPETETSFEEQLRLNIIDICRNIKIAAVQMSIVDASKNVVNCFMSEIVSHECQEFILYYTKEELMEKKSAYLPNDVLSLLCECSFSFGNLVEEVEVASSNCPVIEIPKHDEAYDLPVPAAILINDLKSMLNNGMFSDVTLKTRNKTYPSHKCILGARSPVFKAKFSNDMEENITDCVDIDDLSDETLWQMLRYLYRSDVKKLDWGRATELYEAAVKYQILNLKDICSSFLKTHLCRANAGEALVLANLHQDEDLKSFVQDFILRDGKNVINSQGWKDLMKTNVELAAEMSLKFIE